MAEKQRACLGRDHPDLLQQLQNVGTQPVFDNFPGSCCFTMALVLQARYKDGD